ncbi:MAG: hypothetical protein U9N01_04520 [Euryarchaeota archaeon]|nr:hypothetical protein [Euryarchaeota archaeon]
MKGYPKYFATKEDYENIKRDFPEWRRRVKAELKKLKAIKDEKIKKATTLIDSSKPELGYKTVEVINPFPRFKQKGVKTKKELSDLIVEIGNSGGVAGIK